MLEQNYDKNYRLKRIIYQSTHRGCKELDIILGNFVNKEVEFCGKKVQNIYTMTENQLNEYEELCKQNEWDIYGWITGEISVPNQFLSIIHQIINLMKF